MIRKIVSLILVAGIVSAMVSSCAKKREIIPLSGVTHIEDNRYSCTFDDIEHEFILCLPEETKGAPLVLMLHGAGESADVMRRTTEFDEAAVPEGYAVCYVNGAVDKASTHALKGWNAGTAGGENRDTEFLVSLATYLENEYQLDTKRTFAVGFSYGGFMGYRLAVEAPDIFEAAVSVAGIMPLTMWEARRELLMSFIVFAASAFVGFLSQLLDPEFCRIILGDGYVDMTLQNIAAGKPMAVYNGDAEDAMFGSITMNNVRVSFITYVMGIFTSIGTGTVLFVNGVMLGSFQTFFAQHGLLGESALERMMLVAGDTEAAMLYSDRYTMEQGVRKQHPVICEHLYGININLLWLYLLPSVRCLCLRFRLISLVAA